MTKNTNPISTMKSYRLLLFTLSLMSLCCAVSAQSVRWNSFTTNQEPSARLVVTNIANAAVRAGATNFTRFITNGSTTATWQDAVTSGGAIFVEPGTYSLSNIIITVGVHIYGNGAVVSPAAGVSNFLFDTYSNTPSGPVVVDHLIFDGLVNGQFYDNSFFTLLNNSPDPYYNANWTNLSGIRLASASGGTIQNCTFRRWPGQGIHMVNTNSINAHTKPRVSVINNTCYSNFIGCTIVGANYHYAGYYNNGLFGPAISAEYTQVRGNQFTYNTFGLFVPSGNAMVMNNQITESQLGILVGACGNAAHGIYANNTINHNIRGMWFESNNGGVVEGNAMLANTSIMLLLNTVTECQIQGNYMSSSGAIIMTNVCTGSSFVNNNYQGTWGSTFTVNITNHVTVAGNQSTTVAGNTDGSYQSLARFGNVTGTNANVVGTITATQVVAPQTNIIGIHEWNYVVPQSLSGRWNTSIVSPEGVFAPVYGFGLQATNNTSWPSTLYARVPPWVTNVVLVTTVGSDAAVPQTWTNTVGAIFTCLNGSGIATRFIWTASNSVISGCLSNTVRVTNSIVMPGFRSNLVWQSIFYSMYNGTNAPSAIRTLYSPLEVTYR